VPALGTATHLLLRPRLWFCPSLFGCSSSCLLRPRPLLLSFAQCIAVYAHLCGLVISGHEDLKNEQLLVGVLKALAWAIAWRGKDDSRLVSEAQVQQMAAVVEAGPLADAFVRARNLLQDELVLAQLQALQMV